MTEKNKPFYLNVEQYKGRLYITEIDEYDKKHSFSSSYQPCFFIVGDENDKKCIYRSIDGRPLKRYKAKNIYDYYELLKNENISSIVAGDISPNFQYISEKYPYEISPDFSKIRVCYLDIETGPDRSGNFPDPKYADGEILSIALKYSDVDKFIILASKPLDSPIEGVEFVKCDNEIHLLKSFLKLWKTHYPDVITGWFISTFDMPYLYNRILNVLGEDAVKHLSPFGICYLKTDLDPIRKDFHDDREVLHIVGIQELDYIRLYRKFGAKSEVESYSLNYISELELGEKKVAYEGNLFDLYRNDFRTFVEYNIHDVRLVEKLEEKLQLLYLAFSLAYFSKVTFRDVFFQVRMWDSIIYNYLIKKNIVVPYSKSNDIKSFSYAGAYVKDPQIGMKDWTVSFDVTSLYPHLIIQYNISPDTLYSNEKFPLSIDDVLNENIPESIQTHVKENNLCIAANGICFKNDKQGFLPELMIHLFNERKKYKKLYIENKKKYEETKKIEYKNLATKFDILQSVKKVCLNSAYGALGNQYFRFFNVNLAEAVTLSGQLTIRWIEKYSNVFLNEMFNTENNDYCIASDTDSVYLDLSLLKDKVKTSDEVDSLITNKFQVFLNKKLVDLSKLMNCVENKIELKREIIADRAVFVAKKRYCMNVLDSEGVKFNPPQLKIMGLEAIKSSTPKICRTLLKEAITIILQKDENELQKFYKDIVEKYPSFDIDDISFPRSISSISKYSFDSKSIPIHVYGSLVYNRLVKEKDLKLELIKDGDKIKFVYLKKPNWLNSHVFSYLANRPFPKEFLDIKEIIDYDKMIETSFVSPLNIIIEKINWSLNKKESLIDLFV